MSDLRYIAREGKAQQAYDLADTLENIPGLLVEWNEESITRVKTQLVAYENKYKETISRRYVPYLGEEPVSERF
jgi:hypothetical protein